MSIIKTFLAALHRGSAYHYLWYVSNKQSAWLPTSEPLPDVTGQADVYFGVHPCYMIPPTNAGGEIKPPAQVRSQLGYIGAVNCLFADFDAKQFVTKADPDLDRGLARTLQHITKIDPPPTALIPSGGGFHAYWILSEPWILRNTADRQQASKLQARWCDWVGGDKGAHDLARVLRVPGTLNTKYTPSATVGPMEYHPERVYDLDDLAGLLPEVAERAPQVTDAPPQRDDVLGGDYWLEKYKEEAREGITSRHKCAVNMALQLRADGYAKDEAAVFVAHFAEYCETLGPCKEPAIVNLSAALEWAYSRPDFDWQPAGNGHVIGQVIIRDPDEARPVPDTIEEMFGADVPPLPDSVKLDPALGAGVCKWLDEYVALSRSWSPRAYDDFHIACALWLLSTVAARRVIVHLGGPRYPNLYIALVARTSLWAKSTTAKIVNQTLREAGLSWMLAPDDSTPQRFITDLVQKVPDDWGQMDPSSQRAAMSRLAFAASRGWFYEEMGQKLDAMLAPAGFMADFRGILRSFDDCPETYNYASIGRGLDLVKQPYIAMLGNMTPADLQRATAKSPGLWQDGFWARWAFVTPPGDCNSSRARFPKGMRDIPYSIVDPIRKWHARLGIPEVEVTSRQVPASGKEKAKTTYDVFVDPQKQSHVLVDEDAEEAFYAYHDGLLDVVEKLENRDFDGNYARFAEKALRVAMLIASLENDDQITLPIWARAQNQAERWRRSLHELHAQANEPPPSLQQQREDKAYEIVRKLGEPTANEVARYVAGVSGGEMVFILDGMVASGALVKTAETKRGRFHYALPHSVEQ